MSKKYYNEPFKKDTRYRSEYVDTITTFLEKSREQSNKTRAEFISPALYKENPEFYRQKYVEMLGFPLTQARVTPKLIEKTLVAVDGDITIYRMQFLFFDTLKFYGIYLEQTKNAHDAPFVMCMHGGNDSPELITSLNGTTGTYHELARRFSDRGASVFAPQLLLWKQADYGNPYNREYVNGKLTQLGGSITALELYLLRGVIDYFVEKERINADKIGAAGLSYGGMYTLFLTALDARIKACYPCSWVNDEFIHSRNDWSYKTAQNLFTTADVAGLIAPRAMITAMGDNDALFNLKYTQNTCNEIKKYYQALDADDNFKLVCFQGIHELDPSDEEHDFVIEKLM